MPTRVSSVANAERDTTTATNPSPAASRSQAKTVGARSKPVAAVASKRVVASKSISQTTAVAAAKRAAGAAAKSGASVTVSRSGTTSKSGSAFKSVDSLLNDALAGLKRASSKAVRDGMSRFNLPNENAFGVKMADIQKVGKQLGRHHELAEALWATGIYEARMLSAYVGEPERVTPAQMDRWSAAFDNWAVCDTLCFALWNRTAHAWKKAEQWTKKKPEFQKRAGFALFWCLSVHDKVAPDAGFLIGLKQIEAAAQDERHFVKKAVNMALRAIGKRNKALNTAAITVASRLAASQDATARWIGKDALREITGAAVKQRLSRR